MTQAWAETTVYLALAYLAIGLVFSVVFVTRGVAKLDPSARDAGWGFRLVIVPGVAALWPLLLRRWLTTRGQPPTESTAHRRASR